MKKNLTIAVLAGMGLLAVSASAATMNFTTTDGSATIITGSGTVQITLTDTAVDPISVAQNISGFGFTLSGGLGAGATLSSSSGMERTVHGDGTFANGSTVSTGWSLTGLFLDVLGTSIGPAHTIIGAPGGGGSYDLANGSIAGNGPHNPFLAGSVTFTLDVPNVNADTTASNPVWQFGTAPGGSVPDGGTTVMLLGAALSGLGMLRRKLS